MASRMGISISGHCVVSINAMSIHICTLIFFRWTVGLNRTLYLVLFLKLNDNQTQCFNFGLRRIPPNSCKSELN